MNYRKVRWLPMLAAAAVGLAACGGGGSAAPSGTGASSQKGGSTSATAASPAALGVPLPQSIKSKGKLKIGVKCDYPPFGFINASGQKTGYDVDLGRQLATYAFGSPNAASFTCVTSANRIPYLTSGKIDLIAATMTYLPSRAKVVKFSKPSFKATGKMLVPKSSTATSLTDFKGKTVESLRGADYADFVKKCLPKVNLLTFDTADKALTALSQNRAQAFVEDDTLFIHLVGKNSQFKIVGKGVETLPWGLGTRKSQPAFGKWLNAALAKMKQQDLFYRLFTKNVSNPALQKKYADSMPRPNNTLHYPKSAKAATSCAQLH